MNEVAKNRQGANDSTSRSLIARLKKNETPAWRELVELYSPLILFWCQRFGLPRQECHDLAQEVFRSVITGIVRFEKKPDRGTFRAWLRTVTRNKVMDFFRRDQNQVSAVGGSEANARLAQTAEMDDEIERDEDELKHEHALFIKVIKMIRNDFTEQTWKAFWQVTIHGHAAHEVGQQLGMSPGAVRVAKSRVLKRLREQLGDTI